MSRISLPNILTTRKIIRVLIPLALFIGIMVGIGPGTLCTVGIESIAYICPLGTIETLLGADVWAPRALVVLGIVAVLTIIFGKAFCSWVCPVPPLSDLLSTKKRRKQIHTQRTEAAKRAEERASACTESCSTTNCSTCAACNSLSKLGKRRRIPVDGRMMVLAGTLGSSFVFGFPVFCLICPIGLIFASAMALNRLVGFNEPTFGLILFPVAVILELTLLRNWCHRFCPISALFSLLSGISKITLPKVDKTKCLRTEGVACHHCASVCPELLDPCADMGDRPLSECTRCGRCITACPKNAVSFRGPALLTPVAKMFQPKSVKGDVDGR